MGSLTFANLRTEIGILGHWNTSNVSSTDYAAATAAAKAGLRAIDRLVVAGANFPWTSVDTYFNLTTPGVLTDGYRLTVPARCARLKAKGFRYSTSEESRLTWAELEVIDRALQPVWRTASSTKGTPAWVTREGNEIWIGDQPNTTHLASYPYLYYGYYKREDSGDATLLLPDELFDCAVHAGLAAYLKHKDDTDWRLYNDLWTKQDKPMLYGWSGVSGAHDRMDGAPLAQDDEDEGTY